MRKRSHGPLLVAVAVVLAAGLVAVSTAILAPRPAAADPVVVTVPPGASPCLGSDLLSGEEAPLFGSGSNGIVDSIFDEVFEAAKTRAADAAVGWVLDTIFGAQTDPDTAKLQQQVDAMNTKLDHLQVQITELKAEVEQAYNELFTDIERADYDSVSHNYTLDQAKLTDALTHFEAWTARPVGSPIDGGMSDLLLGMRRDLGTMIEHIHNGMVGIGSARGMIEIYSSVVFRTLPNFDPALTKPGEIYTSELTDPLFDQLTYWKGLVVQIFNVLSEVYHLTWSVGGVTYQADPTYVTCVANKVQSHFTEWEQKADHGLGRLPAGVFVDQRNHLMWTRVPISPPQHSAALPGLQGRACWYTSCFPDVTQDGELPAWLATTTLFGKTGWSVPTKAQFSQLIAGQAKPVTWMRQNNVKWPGDQSWSRDVWYPYLHGFFVAEPWSGAERTVASYDESPLSADHPLTYQSDYGCIYTTCFHQPQYAVAVRSTMPGLGGEPEPEAEDTSTSSSSTTTAPQGAEASVVSPRYTG